MNPDDTESYLPRPRSLRPPFQLAFCLVFGLGLGMLFDRWVLMAFVPSDAISNFHLMAEAWNTIERYYVDRPAVNPQKMTYGAISGMVDALGDTGHSVFLSPDMVKQLRGEEKGRLRGVGIEISVKNGQLVIVAPFDNSPAQRAGLRPGDIILSVDGRDVARMSISQVVSNISGPVGTKVELGILSPKTHHVRDVTLVRALVQIQDVTWQPIAGTRIADIHIAGFDDDMSRGLVKALAEIKQQQMRGLILDLRNNPGGELDQAVLVASQFLAGGNVLLIKNARGEITPIPVKPGGMATNVPMAVIINHGSASAAEILAGALKDAHRAELIGETTFGTGTVLNEFPLSGGSAILLAIEEWLTPDGNSFWHKGIAPEMQVTNDTMPLVPAAIQGMSASELQASGDDQLLAALKWVEGQIGADKQ